MRIALACLAGLLLAACAPQPGGLFYTGPDARNATDFAEILSDPGVFAGREVTLLGTLTVRDGQACIADRGRYMAVRLTRAQLAEYQYAVDWPIVVRGRFEQYLCPRGMVCPALCAPFGIDAGADLLTPTPG